MSPVIIAVIAALHAGFPSASPTPSLFPGVSFWGPVSEWFGGIATLLAVVVALWTSLASERRLTESKYAAVFAWFELPPDAEFGFLCVRNNTEYPIYEWEIKASWQDTQTQEKIIVAVGSRDDRFGLLPPTEFHRLPVTTHRPPRTDAEVSVEIRFKDGMQRKRHRLNSGQLS